MADKPASLTGEVLVVEWKWARMTIACGADYDVVAPESAAI